MFQRICHNAQSTIEYIAYFESNFFILKHKNKHDNKKLVSYFHSGIVGRKGQKGDTVGEGKQGAKGAPGSPGPKGLTGDPGRLRPGNELRDFKGEMGDQGPKGDVGPEGPKGKLRVAPGPLGLAGQKGFKGDNGEFGPRGDIGATGFKGDDGLFLCYMNTISV